MGKGQVAIIVIGIFLIMFLFVGAAVLLSNIGSNPEFSNNGTIMDYNTTDHTYGENLTGSTREQLLEKIKDPNIAPPELSG